MSIPFTCPACRTTFKVKDKYAGRRGSCPHCGASIDVPAAASPPAADLVSPSVAESAHREMGSQASHREAGSQASAGEKIKFNCQHCGARYSVRAGMAGRAVACQKCGHRLVIPGQSTDIGPEIVDAELIGPAPASPTGALDDLFSELDSISVADATAATTAAAMSGPARPVYASPRGKASHRTQGGLKLRFYWPDLALGAFLIPAVGLAICFGPAAGFVVVYLGCIVTILVQMFVHRRALLGFVCFLLTIGPTCLLGQAGSAIGPLFLLALFGPAVTAICAIANPQWKVQKVGAVLLLFWIGMVGMNVYAVFTVAHGIAQQNTEAPTSAPSDEPGFAESRPRPTRETANVTLGALPSVTISNFEAYLPEGSDQLLVRFDYVLERPPGTPPIYWLEYEHESRSALRLHMYGESGGTLYTTLGRPGNASKVRVWIAFGDFGPFDNREDRQTISNVATATVQRKEPPWPAEQVASLRSCAEERFDRRREPELPPLDAALRDLQSGDAFRLRRALKALVSMPVDKARRDEVAAVLIPLVRDSDFFTRQHAFDALVAWRTDEALPTLVESLSHPDVIFRHHAIEALGALRDTRLAGPIAERLIHFEDQLTAAASLQMMGSIAEEEVVTYLKHPDADVRIEACRTLAKIGTAKSAPELIKLESDPDLSVRLEANEALRGILDRHERDANPFELPDDAR